MQAGLASRRPIGPPDAYAAMRGQRELQYWLRDDRYNMPALARRAKRQSCQPNCGRARTRNDNVVGVVRHGAYS